ncbi:hypothetical protein [Arthrobacter glacialis]|uniref:hypothetical protein n=1 Tax=Arthrobacter glacialis TaxID=1664 RepID=UPI000CD3F187|nr:hypothetical protein [Arthrobacter glacialis]POH56977.1 hypothetical protein CVS28_18035 [Arthrobacter glacialis]
MGTLDIINSVGASVGAVAAVSAAIFAGWGIRRTTNDNRARAQPVLVAEFGPSEFSSDTIRLIVKNMGATPARDIQVVFEPPIPEGAKGSHAWVLHERYDKAIPTLAPGQQLGNSWWLSDFSLDDPSSRNVRGLPNEVKVTFTYTGLDGVELSDFYNLNVRVALLEGNAVSSSSVPGRLEMIATSTKVIADSVKSTIPRIAEAMEERKAPAHSENVADLHA